MVLTVIQLEKIKKMRSIGLKDAEIARALNIAPSNYCYLKKKYLKKVKA